MIKISYVERQGNKDNSITLTYKSKWSTVDKHFIIFICLKEETFPNNPTTMAGAVGKMMEGMLHMSDSQKAFSPWWEDLEGKLLYSLMILGKV